MKRFSLNNKVFFFFFSQKVYQPRVFRFKYNYNCPKYCDSPATNACLSFLPITFCLQVINSASNSPNHPDSPGNSDCLSLSPLNVGSPSSSNPHSPGHSTVGIYKVICTHSLTFVSNSL